jgi:hypothetical protein
MSSTIRWIQQKHPNGCGIAALAMASGREYDEVAAAFPRFPEMEVTDHGVWVYMERLGWFKRAVWRAEDCGGLWPPEPFAEVHIAIVVNPSNGHFVVMDATGRVYDPLDPTPKRLMDWPAVSGVYGFVRGPGDMKDRAVEAGV